MPVEVDHHVVPGFSGVPHEPPPIPSLLPRALVPRQDPTHKGMGLKQPFHRTAHQHVEVVFRMRLVPRFQRGRGQNHVAQERRLDEQNASRRGHSEKVMQVGSDRDVVLAQGLGQRGLPVGALFALPDDQCAWDLVGAGRKRLGTCAWNDDRPGRDGAACLHRLRAADIQNGGAAVRTTLAPRTASRPTRTPSTTMQRDPMNAPSSTMTGAA